MESNKTKEKYLLKLHSQKVRAHFSQKFKKVFEKGPKDTIMFVFGLFTTRQ
jgi:hypothetical protein